MTNSPGSVIALVFNQDGALYLRQHSESSPSYPSSWDVTVYDRVPAGETSDVTLRLLLLKELGVDLGFASRQPLLALNVESESGTGTEFVHLYTVGPLEGPFRPPASPEIAQAAFMEISGVDSYVKNYPKYVSETLLYFWKSYRAPIVQAIQPAPLLLPEQNQPSTAKGLLGGLGAAAFLLFQKAALFLKFGKTILSMGLMIWVYSWKLGWPFSVGFVLLIFLHEMGHVLAARMLGIPVSAPMFIPFVGAAVALKQNPRDVFTEALLAYGGPLAGALGATLCLGIGLAYHLPLFYALAFFTFIINLINLAPIPALDGGKICAAVSTWFWLLGMVLMGALILYLNNTYFFVVMMIFILFGIGRFKSAFFPSDEQQRKYYEITIGKRLLMAFLFLILAIYLIAGFLMTAFLQPLEATI